MLVISPKVRAVLTLVATVVAVLIPLLPVGSPLQVALGGLVTLAAAIGIVPAHLEVEDNE